MRKLRPRIKNVITGLGTGEHFEYWGFSKDIITELDWFEQIILDDRIEITATPARHFSGRLFKRNRALWVSFVIKSSSIKLFVNGDSGRDSHYKEIGKQFGPFDFALMECGQYNYKWPNFHHFPEQVVDSVIDLKAKGFIPGHLGKFALAQHSWYEPLDKVYSKAISENVNVFTPIIGEILYFNQANSSTNWWKAI